MTRGDSSHLDRLLVLALDEDLPHGDVTTDSIIDEGSRGVGRFVARQATVLAGSDAAVRVFELVDPEVELELSRSDGDSLGAGETFATASGSLQSLFRAERTALNVMQRLCGIAANARAFVEAVAGTGAQVVDTRKTTPGMRRLEKLAVAAGGARNHRASLSDGVLIKTNHVRAAGSIAAAVGRARQRAPHTLRIEVEVVDLAELAAAIEAGADICMLDNMSVADMTEAVKQNAGRCLLEASGGVRLETVREVAETGVDLVSVGALTHSAPAADLAFEIELLA